MCIPSTAAAGCRCLCGDRVGSRHMYSGKGRGQLQTQQEPGLLMCTCGAAMAGPGAYVALGPVTGFGAGGMQVDGFRG